MRASRSDEIGELLGYGARTRTEPAASKVTISNADGYTLTYFVSDPTKAEFWARERAADLAAHTGSPVEIEIEYPEP